MGQTNDPTKAIRLKAGDYPNVIIGKSCTQTSFKIKKKAFLYIGEQGGAYKAMFKLNASRADFEQLADQQPDRYQLGSTSWVTARFSKEAPLPNDLWEKWLDESHALCC